MEAVSKIIGLLGLIIFFSFLFSWPVMALWNACLIPAVDGVHPIGWLQAWGLTFLSAFLFKNNSTSAK